MAPGGPSLTAMFRRRIAEPARRAGWTKGRRIAAAALFSLGACLCARAEPARPQPGFFFCAAPYSPACATRVGKSDADRKACDEAMRIYVQSVFAYRECLSREMERAVRESNDVIDIWKCRKGERACPQ